MITNTWIYIFLYLRNTAILENKTKKFVFSRINLWTLVTFTFTPCKIFKLTNRQHLYWVCANILHSYTVGKSDIICPSEGVERLKATSLIVRNYPCEYTDWHQRIQKREYHYAARYIRRNEKKLKGLLMKMAKCM